MRNVSTAQIAAEARRLGALSCHTWINHPAGVELHGPGDVLLPAHGEALLKAAIPSLLCLDPGEDRATALESLGVERSLAADLPDPALLAEETSLVGMSLPLRAGTAVDPTLRATLDRSPATRLAWARPASEEISRQMRTYLDLTPAPPRRAVRPPPATGPDGLWAPLDARCRVLVAHPDDVARLRLTNALLAAGHDPVPHAPSAAIADAIRQVRPDVVLLGLEGVEATCIEMRRQGAGARVMVAVACVDDARKLEAVPALMAGANDILLLPATGPQLGEKLRSWMAMVWRQARLPIVSLRERRLTPRRAETTTCALSDPRPNGSLRVTHATVVDYGDVGMRIEYALLDAPELAGYRPHSVHPLHPLWAYARENPGGRDVLITLTLGSVGIVETPARFVHVRFTAGSEVAGLSFGTKKDMGTVRRPRF